MRNNGMNTEFASSFIRTLPLVSDLHRIMRSIRTLADFTASREFHPAPKICLRYTINTLYAIIRLCQWLILQKKCVILAVIITIFSKFDV